MIIWLVSTRHVATIMMRRGLWWVLWWPKIHLDKLNNGSQSICNDGWVTWWSRINQIIYWSNANRSDVVRMFIDYCHRLPFALLTFLSTIIYDDYDVCIYCCWTLWIWYLILVCLFSILSMYVYLKTKIFITFQITYHYIHAMVAQPLMIKG